MGKVTFRNFGILCNPIVIQFSCWNESETVHDQIVVGFLYLIEAS